MRWLFAVLLALAFTAAPAVAAPLESTQANIHYNLALKQYQVDKLEDAKGSLAKALGLVPKHPQANLLLGIIASRQNRFADAIEPLKTAAAGMPTNPEAFNNLGVAQFQLGKLAEAEDAFKHVLALQPKRPDVAMNLGVLALRQKKYADAKAAFLKAAEAEPGNDRAWLGLGEAADGSGDRATGTSARSKALELQPNDKALRLELGERLYQAERLSEASKVLTPLKGAGESGAEFLLGVLAYRRGAFDESRDRFEAALAARPDYPEARYNLAITFYDQGRYDEALRQFQAVLDKHPNDDEARKNLDVTRQASVRAYLKDGSQDFLKADYAAALDRWRKALALDAGNKVVKDLVDTAEAQMKLQAEELSAKGQADWAAGKKEEAIRAWAQALERDPSNAASKAGLDGAKDEVQRLAQAYRKGAEADLSEGRLSKARAQAEKVAALDKAIGKAWAKRCT
jgi:tetratricopeptide (TPR) repeat protein